MASGRAEEDSRADLLGLETSMKSAEDSDPAADARTSLGQEHDTRMDRALGREAQEILIVRTEDSARLRGSLKVVPVFAAQQPEVADGYGVDSRAAELSGHLGRYVLVEEEPDLTQR